MKLVVTPQALEDLRDIERYIGDDNPKAAIDFVQRLTDRFQELVASPGIGRKRDDLSPGMRSSRVGDHLIFYEVQANELIVLHVLHGARDLPRLFQQD